MTDRELLELAAKAEGIEIKFYGGVCKKLFRHVCDNNFFDSFAWNPLEDDGDALRLAVKLEMDINHEGKSIHCLYWTDRDACHLDSVIEPCNSDPYAATRRAIVRAAAEIGRNMK